MAIGGLFSVVLVSDHSAWELPSALPMKSGLSSRHVTATSGHPVLSLAQAKYKKRCDRMQEAMGLVAKSDHLAVARSSVMVSVLRSVVSMQ